MPQLLKVLAKDDHVLANWLLQSHDYTSPQIKNELLSLFGNTIVRQIVTSIKSQSVLQYSIIIDGTQDISGKEQESICFRYVDHDLVPHEDFVGLYEVSGNRGEEIAKVAEDVIQRMNLPLSGSHGQTYDRAANMAGKVNGTQALVKRHQPLALYVHCGVHCSHLIAQSACNASTVVCDFLFRINELGCLSSQSGKFKAMFKANAGPEPNTALKPLCPTVSKWTF